MSTFLPKSALAATTLTLLASATLIGNAWAVDLDALAKAAKAEGQLTVIALPHDWCNYGEVIDGFKAKFPGITVNELNPEGSSGDELEAIRANKGNTGAQAPDVIDIGVGFGPEATKSGLVQPYKVAAWDEIPADIKDPDGYWFADYYGVMAFGINKDLVKNIPADWSDLLKAEYSNAVSLTGDPRVSNQAILALTSAGLAAGADIDHAGEKGLEFFAALNKTGNFVPVSGKTATLAQGLTPIIVAWDYNLLAWRDGLAGNPQMDIVVPASASLAGVYVQAISAYAPHPNAAKLWLEYLYSDEGQTLWLKGYCHPARFNTMAAANKFPQKLLEALPPAAVYAKAIFPTIAQQDANKKAVADGWDKVVGIEVK